MTPSTITPAHRPRTFASRADAITYFLATDTARPGLQRGSDRQAAADAFAAIERPARGWAK